MSHCYTFPQNTDTLPHVYHTVTSPHRILTHCHLLSHYHITPHDIDRLWDTCHIDTPPQRILTHCHTPLILSHSRHTIIVLSHYHTHLTLSHIPQNIDTLTILAHSCTSPYDIDKWLHSCHIVTPSHKLFTDFYTPDTMSH